MKHVGFRNVRPLNTRKLVEDSVEHTADPLVQDLSIREYCVVSPIEVAQFRWARTNDSFLKGESHVSNKFGVSHPHYLPTREHTPVDENGFELVKYGVN